MTYLKFLKNLDFSKFREALNEVARITNKSKIYLFFDMILSSILYGAGYNDYWYGEFYNLKHKERKTVFTRVKNNTVVKKFNDPNFAYIFNNKVTFLNTFKDFIGRDYLEINKDKKDEFISFFEKEKKIVLKPLDKAGGDGIELKIYKDRKDAEKVFNNAIKNEQFLVEGFIKQHEDLNKLYSKTVNTVRVFTYYNNGNPKVLFSIMKIGSGELQDNISKGGMFSLMDDKGILLTEAIDYFNNIFLNHPISNYKLKGFKVPLFEEVKNIAKKAALVVKEVQFVGWDIAITKDKPLIVEGNFYPGGFPIKPSLTKEYGLAKLLEEEMNTKL